MMWVVDHSDVDSPKETLNKTRATFFLIELLYSLLRATFNFKTIEENSSIFGVVKD